MIGGRSRHSAIGHLHLDALENDLVSRDQPRRRRAGVAAQQGTGLELPGALRTAPSGGHPHDLQLGLMLKAAGARCSAFLGAGAVSVDLYPTAWESVVGADRAVTTVRISGDRLRGLKTSPLTK